MQFFAASSLKEILPFLSDSIKNKPTKEYKVVTSVNGSSVAAPAISYSGTYIYFGIGGKLNRQFGTSDVVQVIGDRVLSVFVLNNKIKCYFKDKFYVSFYFL